MLIVLGGETATGLLPTAGRAPLVSVIYAINLTAFAPRPLATDMILKKNLFYFSFFKNKIKFFKKNFQ